MQNSSSICRMIIFKLVFTAASTHYYLALYSYISFILFLWKNNFPVFLLYISCQMCIHSFATKPIFIDLQYLSVRSRKYKCQFFKEIFPLVYDCHNATNLKFSFAFCYILNFKISLINIYEKVFFQTSDL